MANELTVVTKEIVAPVVGNANEEYFESLNSIIDKIGEHSGEVEFEVREEAIKYIDEFENILYYVILAYDKLVEFVKTLPFGEEWMIRNTIIPPSEDDKKGEK